MHVLKRRWRIKTWIPGWERVQPHLETGQGDLERNVQRSVDNSRDRLNEGHEEQREPDDTDEQHHDHPSHPVLHHLLLLLSPWLWIPLHRREIRQNAGLYGNVELFSVRSVATPAPSQTPSNI